MHDQDHCKKYNTSTIWLWEMPPNYWERNPVKNKTKWNQNLFGTLFLFVGSRENDIWPFLQFSPKNWDYIMINRENINTLVPIP